MADFWYQSGSIPEAIKLSKQQSKLFLVYVTGNDDASRQMDACWMNDRIGYLCHETCVSLKLDANSESCKQFSAIYPVLSVPSAYFIDNKGKLVETVHSQISKDEFVRKVEVVTKPFLPGQTVPLVHDTKAEGISTSNAGSVAKQHQGESPDPLPGKGDDDSGSEVRSEVPLSCPDSKIPDSNPDHESSELSQELAGQLKQYRGAIAQDFHKEAKMKERKLEKERWKLLEAQKKEAEEKRVLRLTQCRVQFRLPDGGTVVNTFGADDILSTAITYISDQNITELGNRPFTLSQVYPRKTFTLEDNSKTFQELGMVPGASLIVIPTAEAAPVTSSVFTSLITLFIYLLMLPLKIISQIWNFIVPSNQTNHQREEQVMGSTRGSHGLGNDKLKVRRRRPGNMARLSDTQDDDDDNATWNGNSTQQM